MRSSAAIAVTLFVVMFGWVGSQLSELSSSNRAQQGGRDLDAQLKKDRADLAGQWFYEDMSAGFAEAKRTGKPLLIVFR